LLRRKQHIAIKNKGKKGLLFLALLLSLFTFSGVANIAKQNNTRTQSELVLPSIRLTKNTVSYARIAGSRHNKQYLFLSQRLQFAIATAIFNRDVATRHIQQSIPAVPKQRPFLQIHNHIPKATEPPHQA
jgi:hypothetical protein